MEPMDMTSANVKDMACDVVIAGCGVAGLYAALNLPEDTQIVMLSKGCVDECDSMLVQGGICCPRAMITRHFLPTRCVRGTTRTAARASTS